jgi:hypothetical protein
MIDTALNNASLFDSGAGRTMRAVAGALAWDDPLGADVSLRLRESLANLSRYQESRTLRRHALLRRATAPRPVA